MALSTVRRHFNFVCDFKLPRVGEKRYDSEPLRDWFHLGCRARTLCPNFNSETIRVVYLTDLRCSPSPLRIFIFSINLSQSSVFTRINKTVTSLTDVSKNKSLESVCSTFDKFSY